MTLCQVARLMVSSYPYIPPILEVLRAAATLADQQQAGQA